MRHGIDHLVIGAATLEQGAAFVKERLGVEMAPGGEHVSMGTHNRLLRLGDRTYLEVIAVNPRALAARPRWFGLDQMEMRRSLAQRPRLIHWVVCTDDIAVARDVCTEPLGGIICMRRGDFSWWITVAADGTLPMGGVVPSLIQWSGADHPARRLVDSGLSLERLELSHPDGPRLRAALVSLDLAENREIRIRTQEEVALVARIRTPAGVRLVN